MPHQDSSLKIYSFAKEHKKRFNFSLSSSAPFPEKMWLIGECQPPSPGSPSPACKNLTQVPDANPNVGAPGVDAFRFGFNAFWTNQQFGVPVTLRKKLNSRVQGGAGYGANQFGYGISIPDRWQDGHEMAPRALNDVFSNKDFPATEPYITEVQGLAGPVDVQAVRRSTQQPLLGEVNPAAGSQLSTSITGSRRTKQDFDMATAIGGRIPPGTVANLPPGEAPTWWTNQNAWQQFVGEKVLGTFEDLTFEMWWPFDRSRIQGAGPLKNIYVDMHPSYNFHIPEYESSIAATPATLLPNMYVFASERDNSITDADSSFFAEHINLAGKIPDVFIDVLNVKGEKIGEKDKGEYFDKWTRAWNSVTTADLQVNDPLFDLKERYKNLVFPMSNLNLIKNNQGKERLFPMSIKIDFSTDTNTKFADALRDAKLSSALIKHMINTMNNGDEYWSTLGAEYSWRGWDRPGWDPMVNSLYNFGDYKDTRTFDLARWIDEIVDGALEHPGAFFSFLRGIFLGAFTDEVLLAGMSTEGDDSRFQLFTSLMMAVFRFKINKIIDDEFRSFKDLLRGPDHAGPKLAYSETVAYRVQRFSGGFMHVNWTDTDEPSVWFPNSSEIDVLSYVDTQVKYNTPYRYKIWAYQLVIGNKYKYALKHMPDADDEFWAKLCLFNEPNIKLIEVPLYDSILDHPMGIKILDSPPVPPDVNIVPYVGADDKILILLNSNAGSYLLPDIRIIDSDDSDRNDLLHRDEDGQDLPRPTPSGWTRNNVGDTLILFSSDDYANEFEIFRLDKKPKKYSDFAKMRVPITINAGSATSVSYLDNTIQPNRKYYYTFRARDSHGHISNPSPVYEIELVKDNENVYSLINIIDMGLDPDRQITKSGRKFIQIKPSFLQSTLNEDYLSTRISTEPLDAGGVVIEDVFESTTKTVWGGGSDNVKKFKIRVISKKSGKQIDLNVKSKFVRDGAGWTSRFQTTDASPPGTTGVNRRSGTDT